MTVFSYEYIADIFRVNGLFCCHPCGCEASKSVASNETFRQKGINKGVAKVNTLHFLLAFLHGF